jgi:ferrous iron transport protein A
MTLDGVLPGSTATVVAVTGDPAIRRRLLALGLVPGTPVTVVRRAPLGDPLACRLRSYDLTIRRAQAAAVTVSLG